jgi:hypothetical protein
LVGICLKILGIDASGGGEDRPLDAGPFRGPEDRPVEDQVGRAFDLVQIDIAASTMIGRIVEDVVHASDGLGRHSGVEQVALGELDAPCVDQVLDVLDPPARQIVDHADLGPAPDEPLGEVRADERGAAGDDGALTRPIEHSPRAPLIATGRLEDRIGVAKRAQTPNALRQPVASSPSRSPSITCMSATHWRRGCEAVRVFAILHGGGEAAGSKHRLPSTFSEHEGTARD